MRDLDVLRQGRAGYHFALQGDLGQLDRDVTIIHTYDFAIERAHWTLAVGADDDGRPRQLRDLAEELTNTGAALVSDAAREPALALNVAGGSLRNAVASIVTYCASTDEFLGAQSLTAACHSSPPQPGLLRPSKMPGFQAPPPWCSDSAPPPGETDAAVHLWSRAANAGSLHASHKFC